MVAIAALTAGALASCGGNETPDEPDIPSTDVPTEAGKVTFYFESASTSVKLESYASYWLTGGFINFATGSDALEMIKLGDTNTYYVITDAPDTTLSQGNEYQIVQGYNTSSNMAATKIGLQWTDAYKSDEELAYEAMKNPIFTYAGTEQTINLGTHTFSTAVKAPAAPLTNYSVYVSTEALPSYVHVFLPGNWNNWGNTEGLSIEMTAANAERTLWKYNFESIYADTYEYAVALSNTTTVDWSFKCLEAAAGNMKYTIYETDGSNFDDPSFATAVTFDAIPGDPNLPFAYKFIFKNSGTAALQPDVIPAICGGFTGWIYTAMTLTDGVWVLDLPAAAGATEFGIVNMNDTTGNWVGKIVSEDGSNLKVTLPTKEATITITGDYSKLGKEVSAGVVTVE